MKKPTCYLLAIVLALGCVCLFSACGEEQSEQSTHSMASGQAESSEPTEESKYVLPEDCQLYDDGYISFAYPSDWSVTDGSTVILQGTENTNNITVVYEAATDAYEKWTVASFNEVMKPSYDALGMTVSDVKVDQKKKGDLHVTEISYNMMYSGTDMKQTVYVVTVSDRTYSATVTEVVADSALVSNVYDSLTAKK